MRLQSLAFVLLSMPVAAATYTVDSVQQRYPWNGKVDVAYTVSGGEALDPSQAWLVLEMTDQKSGAVSAQMTRKCGGIVCPETRAGR